VADLLARGFPARPRKYWTSALARLAARGAPDGCPRFGYLLEADGAPVGVLLLIFAESGGAVRCNVSSWYVEPAYDYTFGYRHDQAVGVSIGLLISVR